MLDTHQIVFIQVVTLFALAAWMYFVVYRIEKKAPFHDLGIIWLSVLTIYSTLPPIGWMLQGYKYLTPISGRLFYMQPSAEELIYVNQIAISYSIGFVICYTLLRRTVKMNNVEGIKWIDNSKLYTSLILLITIKIFSVMISFSGLIGKATSYSDSYKIIQQAPKWLAQAILLLTSFQTILNIVIIAALMQRWKTHKLWIIFFALLTIFSIDMDGSRASVILSLILFIICYHIFVKAISTRAWLVMGIVGISFFLLWGIRRNLKSWEAVGSQGFTTLEIGEFDAIYANGIDLYQLQNKEPYTVPFTVRFNEFWSFIPSQLLPFEKRDLVNWYLDEYYPEYKAEGGGWVFGAIPQAIIGNGLPEAIIRGILIAIVCFVLTKILRHGKTKWWYLPLYMHLIINAYMSYRNSTFQQLGPILQFVLPSFAIIWFMSLIFSISINVSNKHQISIP